VRSGRNADRELIAVADPTAVDGVAPPPVAPPPVVPPPVVPPPDLAPVDPARRLAAHGLHVARQVGADGVARFQVSGETHPARHVLRAIGGRWDPLKRAWLFEGDDPSEPLGRELAAAGGLADAVAASAPTAAAPANRPHYWGHRQRLRDRFLAGGDNALPDYELLEMLLFFAIGRIDTKPLAKALLARFHTLAGVVNATPEQLGECDGINQPAVVLLRATQQMAARIVRADLTERPVFDNWDTLVDYLRAQMAHRMVEQFRLLFLDRRNVLIADEVQHQGTIDHTPLYPREVVKRCLAVDASAVVMVHNHPSNHPAPSKPDIEMTRQVRDALDRVGIVLHDHLIISRRGHSSFRQMGLLGR
jgi:DNA repair protein RadC